MNYGAENLPESIGHTTENQSYFFFSEFQLWSALPQGTPKSPFAVTVYYFDSPTLCNPNRVKATLASENFLFFSYLPNY